MLGCLAHSQSPCLSEGQCLVVAWPKPGHSESGCLAGWLQGWVNPGLDGWLDGWVPEPRLQAGWLGGWVGEPRPGWVPGWLAA